MVRRCSRCFIRVCMRCRMIRTVYTAQKVNEVVTAQDANHAVHMELKPRDNALLSVKEQVQDHLKKCTQQNTLYPSGCPFEVCVYGSCGF